MVISINIINSCILCCRVCINILILAPVPRLVGGCRWYFIIEGRAAKVGF